MASYRTAGSMNRFSQTCQLPPVSEENALSPSWREFIQFCRDMQHGEIERLCIQDGLPVLAEITKKKVKFTRGV
jgi:hypothetical protein